MGHKIFISYRRDDSAMAAGRLYEHLARHFPREALFMDVDAMQPGMNFVDELDRQVAQCDTFLAVIGPQWTTIENDDGERRLDEPNDFVRIEVASALARDIRVIPILLEGATMPRAEDLPFDIKAMVQRHAVRLRHDRFGADVEIITNALGGESQEIQKTKNPRPQSRPLFMLALAAAAAVLGAGVWFVLNQPPAPDKTVTVVSRPDASARTAADPPPATQAEKQPAQSTPAAPAQFHSRLALVIGNSNYAHVTKLKTPANDAILVADALRSVGYQLILKTDADNRTMRSAIVELANLIQASDEKPLVVFYFAGHGVQVRGLNYLLPIDFDEQSEHGVEFSAIGMNALIETISASENRISIMLFDANRASPVGRLFRSESRGLARVLAMQHAVIGFSTAPGSSALDGNGRSSPYATALAETILQPGLTIHQVLTKVRMKVSDATDGMQYPWDVSSLTGDIYPFGR